MMQDKASICVIGAGLSGLVAAWELSRRGFNVQVVEQHSTAGGMLASMRLGHEYIELLPHHVRKSDRSVTGLLKELGLTDELEWFDSYWYGRVGRKKLGYPDKGFHSLVSALCQEITDCGGLIHYGYTVMDICNLQSPDKLSSVSGNLSGKYQISCVLSDCTTLVLETDYVLYTASCRNFAHITHDLVMPTDYRDALMDVTYKADMCLLMLTKTQLNGCFSRPIALNAPFQRMIEHTNLVGARKYGGPVVYLSGSFSTSHPLWTQSDAEVFREFFKHLQLLNPSITRDDIKTWRLTRTRYATPLSNPGMDLFSPTEGLYVSSMAMVGDPADSTSEYRMDSCISLARQTAKRIDEDCSRFAQKNPVSAAVDRIY